MHEPEAVVPDHPVLVVAYDDKSRALLAASPEPFGLRAVPCASFSDAENYARSGSCRGIMVDLATMVKAKDVERIIAHTLTEIYPTLRVKSMGSMLIPMIMAGDAQQDKSLNAFFTNTCAKFRPRKLRCNKRKEICLPTYIGAERGFTVNISWSGAFIADMNPERFSLGQEVTVTFLVGPVLQPSVEVNVVRIQDWGERRPPGIGVQFQQMDQELEESLSALLKSDQDKDRARRVS